MSFNLLTGFNDLGPAGEIADIQRFQAFNKALRDNAEAVMKGAVGYPQQGTGYVGGAGGTGNLAPLVPQSIQNTIDTASFTMQAIKFWNMISKVNVSSPLHEATRVNQYGSNLDPFFGEGSVPGISQAQYERLVVRVKYLAEYIEITDVAAVSGILGVNNSMLAERTQAGTLALLEKLERQLFNADSSKSVLQFDGLYKQLRSGAPDNYTDARGQGITFQDLIEKIGFVMADPNWGNVNQILVTPQTWQALSNQATVYARHDQRSPAGGPITVGYQGLSVSGPNGSVPIIPCPLMTQVQTPSATKMGTPSGIPNSGNLPSTAVAAGANAASKFQAKDAGTYRYIVQGVGAEGVTDPNNFTTTLLSVAVTAGDSVTFTVSDGPANSSILYYRVYRGPKDSSSTDLKDYKHIFDAPANNDGAGDATTFRDDNAKLPGTAPVYLLQNTPDAMHWIQLLDYMRRPLAQTTTTIPFLLMLFGTLFVKLPRKHWIIDNVPFSF
jgi:hypothetical protein